MATYKVTLMEIPSSYTFWERGGEYMLEPNKWIKVIKRISDRTYKVYLAEDWAKLPYTIKQEDDVL